MYLQYLLLNLKETLINELINSKSKPQNGICEFVHKNN